MGCVRFAGVDFSLGRGWLGCITRIKIFRVCVLLVVFGSVEVGLFCFVGVLLASYRVCLCLLNFRIFRVSGFVGFGFSVLVWSFLGLVFWVYACILWLYVC